MVVSGCAGSPTNTLQRANVWLIALQSRIAEEFATLNCLALAYNVFASYQDWAHQYGLDRRRGIAHARQVIDSGDLPPKRIINQRILGAERPRAEEWGHVLPVRWTTTTT